MTCSPCAWPAPTLPYGAERELSFNAARIHRCAYARIVSQGHSLHRSEPAEHSDAGVAVHGRRRHVDLGVELGAPRDHAVGRRLEDAIEQAEPAGGLDPATRDQQALGGGLVTTARERDAARPAIAGREP